jgi:hypothetical protein
MTPKEKAEELFDKMMYHIMYNCQPTLSEMVAKQCALIAVDEIIEEIVESTDNEVKSIRIIYWEKVKQEINNL